MKGSANHPFVAAAKAATRSWQRLCRKLLGKMESEQRAPDVRLESLERICSVIRLGE